MKQIKSKQICLLSFNIHGCIGRGGRESPQAILDIIRQADADFVALQEVQDSDDADRSFLKGLESLPFAEKVYGTTMRKPQGSYGNLLLSKYPLSEVECVDISHKGREPRGIIFAYSDAYQIPVFVMSTHLGLSRTERSKQLHKLLQFRNSRLKNMTGCLDVLMGDFNEWKLRSENLMKLDGEFAYSSTCRTFPARLPVFPLDRIFINGQIKSVVFRRIDSSLTKIVSDHRPLTAHVTIREQE